MDKKCILFDADGVVINSKLFSVQYQKRFDVSNDEMLPFFKGIFQDCLIGKADLKEVVRPYLKKWKWDSDVDGFLLFWFIRKVLLKTKYFTLMTPPRMLRAQRSKG